MSVPRSLNGGVGWSQMIRVHDGSSRRVEPIGVSVWATIEDLRGLLEADYGKRSGHVRMIHADCTDAHQPQYTQGPDLLVKT